MVNWIVGGVVVIIVGAIVGMMIRDRRNNKSGCGGDCAHCRSCRH